MKIIGNDQLYVFSEDETLKRLLFSAGPNSTSSLLSFSEYFLFRSVTLVLTVVSVAILVPSSALWLGV